VPVVFDAEPLLVFSFDEVGADAVEGWLDRVYDGERAGYVPTINLAEFRYVAGRKTSLGKADDHIDALREMGVTPYEVDGLWERASELKAVYSPSIGDTYALAAAKNLEAEGREVPLLVGADDDFDAFEETTEFEGLVERSCDRLV